MGYFEYFLYSKKKNISTDELIKIISAHNDAIDIFCETETTSDIYSNRIKLFSEYEVAIKPISIPNKTKGIIIGTYLQDLTSLFSLKEKLHLRPRIASIDAIVFSSNSNNIGKEYEDYFCDVA